jgi:hypothetical protein
MAPLKPVIKKHKYIYVGQR